jgi:hypothetical protein
MKKMFRTLKALIPVVAMIAVVALPGAVSADSGNASKDYYWYNLSPDELGAGATPSTGTISVANYHARELIMWASPIALDMNLDPMVQSSLLAAVTKN